MCVNNLRRAALDSRRPRPVDRQVHCPNHSATEPHSAYSQSGLGVTPWPPKRDFGGTPLSTEWLSHLPTKVGLPSVRWPLYEIPRST